MCWNTPAEWATSGSLAPLIEVVPVGVAPAGVESSFSDSVLDHGVGWIAQTAFVVESKEELNVRNKAKTFLQSHSFLFIQSWNSPIGLF